MLLTVLFLVLLAGETLADQQQWEFHRRKAADVAAGREPATRFLQTGLFRFSRHPNFFFEQAQWWVLFLFGAVAAGSLLQWTVLGALLLTALFIGSTIFTESITRSKYPEYADYQATTSADRPVVPPACPPGGSRLSGRSLTRCRASGSTRPPSARSWPRWHRAC